MARASAKRATSIDPAEIARFSAMAEEWWDPDGKFRPLHKFNPTRLSFVRDQLARHFERDPLAEGPLQGLSILDIGCGGGLLAEPLTRLGAKVTGIDASEPNIKVAGVHAAEAGLEIDYRHATAEDLADAGESFDVVLNMEVVEHVADLNGFLTACSALVRPNGAMMVATLNRTPKAFLLGILGAEYLLRWLPPGTHDWRRFVRPSELARALGENGLEIAEIAGMSYNPLTDAWRLTDDVDVNYMAFAVRR